MTQIAITFNTIQDALVALTAVAANNSKPAAVTTKSEAAPAGKPQAPAAPASALAAAAPSPAKTQAAASPSPGPAAQAPADGPLEYAVLQKAVYELAGMSKEAAMAVNGVFGVKTMKELPEEKRRDALKAVQDNIAALKAAAAEVA